MAIGDAPGCGYAQLRGSDALRDEDGRGIGGLGYRSFLKGFKPIGKIVDERLSILPRLRVHVEDLDEESMFGP